MYFFIMDLTGLCDYRTPKPRLQAMGLPIYLTFSLFIDVMRVFQTDVPSSLHKAKFYLQAINTFEGAECLSSKSLENY